jgi:PQQ-like domain
MNVPFRPTPKTIKVATALLAASALLVGGGQILAGASAASTESSPWNQSDYNAAHSRANLTEQVLTPSTVSGVHHLRSFTGPQVPFSCDTGDRLDPKPVLTGGDIYFLSNDRLFKADAATGQILWRRTPDKTFSEDFMSISVAQGLVVVGEVGCGSVSDPSGFIQAFSASTGANVWRSPISSLGGALSDAVVSGNYVAAVGGSVGSGVVVAVHALSNGAQIWAHFECGVNPEPVFVVAQEVIAASCEADGPNNLIANNIATGAHTWTLTGNWTPQAGDAGTSAGKSLVATNPSGTVVDLNPLTGATRFPLSGASHVLAIDTARIYATCGIGVCAYSSTTGGLLWNTSFSETFLGAEAGGVLYLDTGAVLNATTGKTITTLWPNTTGDPARRVTALVVGDGRVAVSSDPRVIDLYGLPGS